MQLQIALKESEKITPYISNSANCVGFFFFNLHTVLVYYIVQSVKNQVTEVGSGKLYGWSKCNFWKLLKIEQQKGK